MPNHRSTVSRLCAHCGTAFFPFAWENSPQKFCGKACRWAHKDQTELEVFWSKVARSEGCWLWTGSTTTKGYGRFKYRKRVIPAHRCALSISLGRQLTKTEFACHGCDNPQCVRVGDGHIFLGTNQDNQLDAKSKGRLAYQKNPAIYETIQQLRGEEHPRAVLNDGIIREIRRLRAEGWVQQGIADKFGIRLGTVAQILGGLIWSHVV